MRPRQRQDGAAGITRRRLLAWFDRHRRDLPWRRTSDPYRVWLSEVMLQQTRVEVALPYFERFLARFPTVETLALAPVEEVLALWSGLGYYRRARQLHAAACRIAAAGDFPRTVEALLQLPGVGAYTAAAVASIAFGLDVPVMDGNVERVTARLLALKGDPRHGAGRARLLAEAASLLDPSRPGDSNQALMELGATLCLPRRPRCPLCPLRPGCRAAGDGQPELYPGPRRKRASERLRLVVAVVARAGRVLLYRRPSSSDLLAGTWELPWLELAAGHAPSGDAGGALAAKYGGEWELGPRLAWVRHAITYRDLRVAVHLADWRGDGGAEVREGVGHDPEVYHPEAESGWFDAAERAALPMSSLVGKVLRAAEPRSTPAGAAAERGIGRLAPCRDRHDPEARIRTDVGRGSPASRSRSRRPG
jgi:A/G-specific adenine glycosylase